MSKPRGGSALLLSLACAAVGCQGDDLPDVQWVGEHVIFAPEHPEQVCAGTREYLDRRAGEMLARLGSESLQVEYYLLDDVSKYCAFGFDAIGCGDQGVVYAEAVPLLHEIVHARSDDGMPSVLEEGLAIHFGDPFPLHSLAKRERLVEMLASNEAPASSGEYARAGHFVAFLAESFGWESLLELDAALSPNSTPAQLDAAFRTTFGLDVAGTLAVYQDFPECVATVDTSLACASPPEPREPTEPFFVTTFERVIDCASAEGVGPHYGMVFVESVIELEPSIAGSRFLSVTGDGGANGGFATLNRCGPCSENGAVRTRGNWQYIVPEDDLPAGKYVVRLYLPVDASPATLGVRIAE